METQFGFKELYQVLIKSTYPIELNGRMIDEGETIAAFESIQIAQFGEQKVIKTANGGFDNRPLVFWETTKDVPITFTQGIFSKDQFALMTGAKFIKEVEDSYTLMARERTESDENGIITFKYAPLDENLYVYDLKGEKLEVTKVDATHFQAPAPYTDVILDYKYGYRSENISTFKVGQPLLKGFVSLWGKTRVKDDITGHDHTGIITIPKLKLMSDLSMKLGKNADPVVGRLDALAIPTGVRGSSYAMEIQLLDEDIDSDV